jgi:bis(5'-nucleosidyl)-tetraphosphatase
MKRAAGVVVVHLADLDRPRFLLLRAYRNWDLPKGLVEPGEDPFAAAVREVEEETGIVDLEFAWGCDYIETEPYGGNKIARFYVARTSTERNTLPLNPSLGRPEHHEYRWCDLAAANALVVPRLKRVLAWAAAAMERPPHSTNGRS